MISTARYSDGLIKYVLTKQIEEIQAKEKRKKEKHLELKPNVPYFDESLLLANDFPVVMRRIQQSIKDFVQQGLQPNEQERGYGRANADRRYFLVKQPNENVALMIQKDNDCGVDDDMNDDEVEEQKESKDNEQHKMSNDQCEPSTTKGDDKEQVEEENEEKNASPFDIDGNVLVHLSTVAKLHQLSVQRILNDLHGDVREITQNFNLDDPASIQRIFEIILQDLDEGMPPEYSGVAYNVPYDYVQMLKWLGKPSTRNKADKSTSDEKDMVAVVNKDDEVHHIDFTNPSIVDDVTDLFSFYGKREDAFYDEYPDIEMAARQLVMDQCKKKETSITAGHDEDTCKSGEVSAKRWIIPGNAPFYNKGRGPSIMCSDFMIVDPEMQPDRAPVSGPVETYQSAGWTGFGQAAGPGPVGLAYS
ncbi:unnamed protein product [Didymodactylos carnosus]|uniref:Uncharacterized protein n=1 Tax=Didymodactylos carnosus TaxID=1234261 RepID=A0A814QHE9_9BILA|nr:unnamed protein product [Didymodactylos carnosus]CAF3883383.1 unnamed protein product [Didymodactylos carnosus]